MGTSLLGGTILFATGDFDSDEPIDTVLVQDALVGSALHKADQVAQVRACWGAVADAHMSDPELEIRDVHGALEIATEPSPKWYGFPVRGLYAAKVKADGSGYRARIRLEGCSSGGDSVDFAVVLSPGMGQILFSGFWNAALINGVVKTFSNITSTTPAQLTPDDGLHYVDIPAAAVRAAAEASGVWTTQTDIGGSATAVQVVLFEMVILGQTFDVGSAPRLYGYDCAEFIG